MVVFYRLYYISQKRDFAMVSNNQSSYVINVASQRGYIYDCNFKPLVNIKDKFIASVIPTPQTLTAIANHVDKDQKDNLLSKIKENKPFLISVKDYNIYNDGIEVINIKKRYQDNQLAPHVIGYLNGGGEGVCGLEKAYNNFLKDNTNKIKIRYKINALNNNYDQSIPTIDYGDRENKYGVVLTIDNKIQKIAENASRSISRGAIIVMDAQNGDLKGVVSVPRYDPDNVVDYLKDENSPLLNRAFSAYNVGSTYKLLVACAALEEDYNKFINFKSTCVGCKQISSNVFRCHFLAGHNTIGMKKALEISCNPYFIDLAINVGPVNIINLSKCLGFGSADVLAKDMMTSKGSLPDKSDIVNQSDVANLGFGQGKLMATPIQIAKMVAMISNGGYLVKPSLVRGLSDKSGKFLEKEEKHFSQARIISTQTAKVVKDMMISVVENGSGKKAKPLNGGAGGKTASAQTGSYSKLNDKDGKKEIIHAWFAGFFPSMSPKYIVVVLVEGGESGSDIAAPIFKEIADKINKTSL